MNTQDQRQLFGEHIGGFRLMQQRAQENERRQDDFGDGIPYQLQVRTIAPAPTSPVLNDPARAAEWIRSAIQASPHFNPDIENMIVVPLNTRMRAAGWAIIGQGTVDSVLTHPTPVFKVAMGLNAHSCLLAHNHPSGDPSPSEADITMTRQMVRAGQVMKIEIRDHIILGNPEHASLRGLGFFYS